MDEFGFVVLGFPNGGVSVGDRVNYMGYEIGRTLVLIKKSSAREWNKHRAWAIERKLCGPHPRGKAIPGAIYFRARFV